ncbi:MAG: Choline dehydrogenase [Ilumatobacteraceae bacterium]|nr:Choline dehydrogenase [Ilumatobacteraceae bacterium]
MRRSTNDDDRIVVIGSGPCGAIAASELVGAGAQVTMLEAGLRTPRGVIVRTAGHTLARWRSMDQMSSNRHVSLGDPDTEWFSSISPGGLSNYWTAAVPRFAPQDFTDGARIDERFRWPVVYDDLVPYYEIAEDFLDVTGPARSLPVLPAGRTRYRRELPGDWHRIATATAEDALTMLPLARGRRWMIARRGSEFNSYHVIVQPLLSSASFELRRGARATRLLVDETTGSFDGVEYHDATTGRVEQIRARAVVVAAGAIDSACILLSSTSKAAPMGIGNEHGLVGRYLHDHPREWWRAEYERPLTLLDNPVYLARGPYDASPPLHGASATIGLAASRDRVRTIWRGKGTMFGVQVFGMMIPDESGRVCLADGQADAAGSPVVEIEMRYDDAALATLTSARERFEAVFAAAGNPAKVIAEDWRPRPGSSVHYGGSVRMHARPELGVLDGWNRVHSMPSVVVCDLACFPTNPEKNPTLTAMALAARAARHLAADPDGTGSP